MNDFFDQIYVITCTNLVERHEHIQKHFEKHKLKYNYVIAPDKAYFHENKLSNSEQSLVCAHLYCIRHAKLHSYKKILICEDDVLFIDSVKTEFDKFIKNVPFDWAFLQLGNQFWATHWLKRNKIMDNLYEFKWGTGSHCIGINNLIFNEAIQTLETYESPVDLLYYSLFKNYPAYCPDNFFADALSKNDHLNYYNSKEIFPSTIFHKNI